MRNLKIMVLASALVLPLGVAAEAADIDPDVPAAADPAMIGLYLRGDIGWSFLDWSGGDTDDTWVAGGGIGYRFSDNLRTDITADMSGDYDVAPGANISTTTVLGNVYFDWANDSMFTPYLGVGAGYGWVNGSGLASDESGLALGAAAGFTVDLTNNLSVDTGYRYRDIMVPGSDTNEHQVTTGFRFSF